MTDPGSLFALIADPAIAEDAAWIAVAELQNTGTRAVLEQARQLTAAAHPRVRGRAASILGQLGIPVRTFPDECLRALVQALEGESDEDVIDAIISAMGHLDDGRIVGPVLKYATHSNDEIRFAVAFALGGRREPEAVAALIALTCDSAAKVRDWATFGIGVLTDANTQATLDALFERLQDADVDARREAMCGLAHHGDKRVAQHLIDHLRNDPTDWTIVGAAEDLLGWKARTAEELPIDEVLESLAKIR